jgi:DNA-binding MarR family transcriptional regulator/GNAT superfamily N-acetyltransferase
MDVVHGKCLTPSSKFWEALPSDGSRDPSVSTANDNRVAAVRRFNRFYTRQLGLLQDGVLYAPFSLTEARVLYELAQRPGCTATELATELGLDHGYLSRILRRFLGDGFVSRIRAVSDGRQALVSLTPRGRKKFAVLDRRARAHVTDLLEKLPITAQQQLISGMRSIEAAICPPAPVAPAYCVRPPRAGDMGWVIARHGAIYADEYGWGPGFEALVADIVAQFARSHDPSRECCFIAELAGEPVGSAFVVRSTGKVAKLRLLIVEPRARGLGIGRRLVEQSLEFARGAGYKSMELWTQKVLKSARKIYLDMGFKLVASKRHRMWGDDVIGETWKRPL